MSSDVECPPKPTCAKLAEDHLEPIRAFVHSRHGMLTKLTQEMQRLTDTPITRQVVSRWLHTEPEKRQEPKLGAFLVMEQALKNLQGAGSDAEAAAS